MEKSDGILHRSLFLAPFLGRPLDRKISRRPTFALSRKWQSSEVQRWSLDCPYLWLTNNCRKRPGNGSSSSSSSGPVSLLIWKKRSSRPFSPCRGFTYPPEEWPASSLLLQLLNPPITEERWSLNGIKVGRQLLFQLICQKHKLEPENPKTQINRKKTVLKFISIQWGQ